MPKIIRSLREFTRVLARGGVRVAKTPDGTEAEVSGVGRSLARFVASDNRRFGSPEESSARGDARGATETRRSQERTGRLPTRPAFMGRGHSQVARRPSKGRSISGAGPGTRLFVCACVRAGRVEPQRPGEVCLARIAQYLLVPRNRDRRLGDVHA